MKEIVDRLYSHFDGRVDREVVEMVYMGCKQNEENAKEQLNFIAADVQSDQNDFNPWPDIPKKVQTSCVTPRKPSNTPLISEAAKPTNIFEQIVKPSPPPVSCISQMMTNSQIPFPNKILFPDTNNMSIASSNVRPRQSGGSLFINSGYMSPQASSNTKELPTSGSLFVDTNVVKPQSADQQLFGTMKLNQADEAQKMYLNNPNRKVLCLMRGLPGSGKSYRARQLNGKHGVIYSTDDFFKKNGRYEFDPTFLGDAHSWNQLRARKAMENSISPIFIDNTNIQIWEMKPYVEQALQLGYTIKVLEPITPWARQPRELAKRNSHGVPKEKIVSMLERYQEVYDIQDILQSKRLPLNDKKNRHRITNEPLRLENIQSPLISQQKNPVISRDRNNATQNASDHSKSNLFSSSPFTTSINDHSKNNILPSLSVHPKDHCKSNVISTSHSESHVFSTPPVNTEKPQVSNANGYFESLLNSCEISPAAKVKNCENKTPFDPEKNIVFDISSSHGNIPTADFKEHLDIEKLMVENAKATNIKKVTTTTAAPIYVNDLETQFKTQQSLKPDNSSSPVQLDKKKKDQAPIIKDVRKKELITEVQQNIIDTTQEDVIDNKQKNDMSSSSSSGFDGHEEMEESSGREEFKRSRSSISDEKVDSQLKFLYECFPDYSRTYCRKWLGKYNYDLVRTCDYLSRASQLEELPEDVSEVITINDDDVEDDDVDDDDVDDDVVMEDVQNEEDLEIDVLSIEEKKTAGEMFYCEDNNTTESKIRIALDKRLVIEMISRFSKEIMSTDTLSSEDLVLEMDEDFGRQMFYMWKDKVKERKRKVETVLKEDELLARKLQKQEDEDVSRSLYTSEFGQKKKKRATALNVATKFTSTKPAHIGGLTNQSNPWTSPIRTDVVDHPQQHRKDASGNVLTEKQMQARSTLHKLYPGVDEMSLDAVLEATSYDFNLAKSLVQSSCGLDKQNAPTAVFSNDWQQVTSPMKSPVIKEVTPVGSPIIREISPAYSPIQRERNETKYRETSLYQTLDSEKQDYADYRTEAALQAELRSTCFQKAAKANEQKNWQVALYYAELAHKHTLQMKEAHTRAAEIIFKKRNHVYKKDQHTIDLHGLHADEAIRALKNFIDNAFRIKHRVVYVITGRGNHSRLGVSTVRKAVLGFLRQKHFVYESMNNGGMLKLFLRR